MIVHIQINRILNFLNQTLNCWAKSFVEIFLYFFYAVAIVVVFLNFITLFLSHRLHIFLDINQKNFWDSIVYQFSILVCETVGFSDPFQGSLRHLVL